MNNTQFFAILDQSNSLVERTPPKQRASIIDQTCGVCNGAWRACAEKIADFVRNCSDGTSSRPSRTCPDIFKSHIQANETGALTVFFDRGKVFQTLREDPVFFAKVTSTT
jgi:hypothetical protein